MLKNPQQGFLDLLKPLEPSILQFEHCKARFLTFFENNENDPLEAGPGDVAQGRGERLYRLLCYVLFLMVAIYCFYC